MEGSIRSLFNALSCDLPGAAEKYMGNVRMAGKDICNSEMLDLTVDLFTLYQQ